MKKIVFKIFFSLLLFFVSASSVLAAEDFSTFYDVTYKIAESGNARADFNITLENNTGNYYASSYKIEVGFPNVKNAKASDPDGQIFPKVIKTDYGQSIELDFNKKVLGKGNKLIFNLSFDTEDVASKRGKIWEINVPGVTNQSKFETFDVHVRVPASFGPPTYIKPVQQDMILDFTKEQLGKSGISIAFGNKQTYSFVMKYHLKNSNLFPIKTEVAIPPTTNYQEVFLSSIDPKPINVREDKDGNWLAQFALNPSQKIEIVLKGVSELSLYPQKKALSEKDFLEYLKEKPYWETSNLKIKELARSLKTPAAIHKYVVKTLNYDFSRVTENKPRLGAKASLQNPYSAVCMEFTDLFIAIARAAGIPSREVDGFAFTDNSKQRPVSLVKDILHAWPEYYDKDLQTWIMVDPTWENTTGGVDYFHVLDFDHFAFTIKGYDSSYPIPAGGYKIAGYENTKDVTVELSESEVKKTQNFEMLTNVPSKSLSGLPIDASIRIKNIGNGILSLSEIIIESPTLSPKTQAIPSLNIPPFGHVNIPFSFEKAPFLTSKKSLVTIRIAGKTFYETIQVSPFFLSKEIILIGGVLIAIFGITIIILFTAARTRRLPFFGRKP